MEDFENLLESTDWSPDLNVKIGDDVFPVKQSSRNLNPNTNEIIIDLSSSKLSREKFETFHKFLVKKKVSEIDICKFLTTILECSDYGIEYACTSKLRKYMNEKNFPELLRFAMDGNEEKLLSICASYFVENYSEVTETDEMKSLLEEFAFAKFVCEEYRDVVESKIIFDNENLYLIFVFDDFL